MNRIEALSEEFKQKLESFMTGCDALEELDRWDKEKYGEMDVYYQSEMVSVILRLIAADGVIHEKEAEYLNRNFGFSLTVDELTEIYRNCGEELPSFFSGAFENGVTLMQAINEKLADAYRELLGLICDVIAESDGAVTQEEAEEIRRMKAQL